MNVNFSSLSLIPQIMEMLVEVKNLQQNGGIEKRWFNTTELSEYTGYKVDSIKTKVKNGEFIQGVHYHKPDRKLLFDKTEIDNWVMGIKSVNNQNFKEEETEEVFDEILSTLVS